MRLFPPLNRSRPKLVAGFRPFRSNRGPGVIRATIGILALAVLAPGCGHEEKSNYTTVTKPPTVRLAKATVRKISRSVGQPSFIEAYERTSIYPKLTGYIEKWNVDIGDRVKKGHELARLFVPELVEDLETKRATVELDKERVSLARKLVEVADANVKSSEAELSEAKAILDKFHAEVERWQTEVSRLDNEVKRGIVDPQILLESTNQWKSSQASRGAAQATIKKAEAELLSSKAMLAKANVDVSVAKADLSVAVSEAKRIEAWVGYITLPAPFDGIIVARNANTYDFVTPSSGDPSAMSHAPHLSPSGTAAPIYVVDRTDIVRIFVDIPEEDANYVHVGSPATVLVRAYRDEPISGSVTRTAWALDVKSRTLRAEIDLPNPNSQLLPGMYAYAKVLIERADARALPMAALSHSGERTFCWLYNDGKAHRVEARTGVSDKDWIEVTSFLDPTGSTAEEGEKWKPVTGQEHVILGDLSILADGTPVEIAADQEGAKLADLTPDAARAAPGELRRPHNPTTR
jgi:multidrug efflux pump subunit AcrA (membrane-fusion protein)